MDRHETHEVYSLPVLLEVSVETYQHTNQHVCHAYMLPGMYMVTTTPRGGEHHVQAISSSHDVETSHDMISTSPSRDLMIS